MNSVWWYKQFQFYVRHPRAVLNELAMLIFKRSVRVCYRPKVLNLFISDRCNLHCYFCLKNTELAEYKHSGAEDMSIETFKKILARLPYVTHVSLCGQGEPFLNRDIFAMIEHARRAHVMCSIVTNGSLLTREACMRLIAQKVLRIEFSLKGVDEDDFTANTRCSAQEFKKVIDAITTLVALRKELRARVPVIGISYVIHKGNLDRIERCIALAERLGVDRVAFNNYIPFTDNFSLKDAAAHCLFDDDAAARDLYAKLRSRRRRISVLLPPLLPRNPTRRYCPCYWKALGIDAGGNIVGCTRVLTPRREFGNIFEDRDFYNTKHFTEMREIFFDPARELPDRCRLCVEMVR